jgi:LysM repeat protein
MAAASRQGNPPPVRKRWAMLLMLIPILLFFSYWGSAVHRAKLKRQANPGSSLPAAAPAPAAPAKARSWEQVRQSLEQKELTLAQKQALIWDYLGTNPLQAGEVSAVDRVDALKYLGEVQMDLLYSTEEGVGKRGHLVEQGQSLAGIAQKYGSTTAAIVRANNLLGTNVQPGQHLVVPELGDIELRGFLTGSQLAVYWQGRILKTYELTLPPGAASASLAGEGTVAERRVVKDGAVVPFGEPAYYEADKAVRLSWGNLEIKAPAAPGAAAPTSPVLYLDSKESLEEIFPLLTASTRVIITQ